MLKQLITTILTSLVLAGPLFAQERVDLIVLLRRGALALPQGVYEIDLNSLLTGEMDARLRDALRALEIHSMERVIKRELDLPPRVPELLPAGAEPDTYDPRRLFLIHLPGGTNARAAIRALEQVPAVIYAELNESVESLMIRAPRVRKHEPYSSPFDLFPNDPANNWGLYNPFNRVADVGAPEAWDYQTGRSSVRIAFLDTGAGLSQPDLDSKIIAGYDFVHDDGNYYPDAGSRSPYHGTSAAGIAAGRTDNGYATPGLCGGNAVSEGCQVLVAKVLGKPSILEWLPRALAWLGNESILVNAIYWSLTNGADVTNNSFCIRRGILTAPYTVHAAYRDAYIRGTLNVVGMGNSSGDCNQDDATQAVPPASYSDIMVSVGATDRNAERVTPADFSWESATGVHIDLTAPGTFVGTLDLGGGTRLFSGTSAATPFVSGAIGLVLSEIQDGGLPLEFYDVPHLLKLMASDPEASPPGYDVKYGAGILKVNLALKVLQPPYQVETGTTLTTSGCYDIVPNSGKAQWVFMHDFDVFLVRRCEIRQHVTFDRTYANPPRVWGRPISTGGTSPSNPNGQVTWSGIVPGSVTRDGAVLRTYVYDRWTITGFHLGWWPRSPGSVDLGYGLVGRLPLEAWMTGPYSAITIPGTFSWTPVGVNCDGPCNTEILYYRDSSSDPWNPVATEYTRTFTFGDTLAFGLKTRAADDFLEGSATDEHSRHISVRVPWLLASISGPTETFTGDCEMYTADVDGPHTPFTYDWYKNGVHQGSGRRSPYVLWLFRGPILWFPRFRLL